MSSDISLVLIATIGQRSAMNRTAEVELEQMGHVPLVLDDDNATFHASVYRDTLGACARC